MRRITDDPPGLLLLVSGLAIWLAFAISTYGCAPAKAPDACDVDLTAITAARAAETEACETEQCVDAVRAKYDQKVDEACK